MDHGRYKPKNYLYPRDLLIHTDRIIAWQGKTEKNIYSQLLVAIRESTASVVWLCWYPVCAHSGLGQMGPLRVSSPTSHLEQDCGQHWIKLWLLLAEL